jgi:hypothetical protein
MRDSFLLLLLPFLFAPALMAGDIRLEQTRVQLGRFPANCPPAASLILVNDGTETLEGIRLRTSCGCLAAVADANSVAAGERLAIRLSVAPEKLFGPFSHGVFVEVGSRFLRATVSGEAIPLFQVRPGNAANLGEIPCNSPFQTEFRLYATEDVSLGNLSAVSLDVDIHRLSSTVFHIILRGKTPVTPGHFRFTVSWPISSPPGWNPLELVVFGNAR